MLGVIAGDLIGSAYESSPIKRTDFPLFQPGAQPTDDTVLTVATAEALLGSGDYTRAYRRFSRSFPHAGYGGSSYPKPGKDGDYPIISVRDAMNPLRSSHPGPRICCRRFG